VTTKRKPADKAAKPARPVGRPSKYLPEYARVALVAAKLGATDPDLAALIGVNINTIKLWSVQHPKFSAARMAGKAAYDDRIEHSLASRALGYEHDETDIRVINGKIVKTPIRKHYPPDPTAAIFWLKNRRGAAWRDKVEQEIKAEVTTTIDKDDLTRRIIFILSENLKAST
jgi:hypothetical protein